MCMAIMSIQFFSNCLRRDVTLQALLPIDRFSSNNETSINETKEFKSLYYCMDFTVHIQNGFTIQLFGT